MQREHLDAVLAEMQARIDEAQKNIATLRAGMEALQLLRPVPAPAPVPVSAQGSSSSSGSASASSAPRPVLRGRAAIDAVLREAPGQWVPLDTMTSLLESRGWVKSKNNPLHAVRTSADRLVAEAPDTYERDGVGNYRIVLEARLIDGDPTTDGGDATPGADSPS